MKTPGIGSRGVRLLLFTAVLAVGMGGAKPALAQAPVAAMEHGAGLGELETLQGEFNSAGSVVRLDSTLTYDLSKRFGVFTGLPLYFTSSSGTSTGTTSTSTRSAGIGNMFLGLTFRAP